MRPQKADLLKGVVAGALMIDFDAVMSEGTVRLRAFGIEVKTSRTVEYFTPAFEGFVAHAVSMSQCVCHTDLPSAKRWGESVLNAQGQFGSQR